MKEVMVIIFFPGSRICGLEVLFYRFMGKMMPCFSVATHFENFQFIPHSLYLISVFFISRKFYFLQESGMCYHHLRSLSNEIVS